MQGQLAISLPLTRPTSPVVHAGVVVAAYTVLFGWMFSRLLFSDVYLAESDLYDWFLPFFLSPMARWSSDIFAGLPLFADSSDAIQYPVNFFFARVVGSWAGYVISAYVIGASLAYAYVFTVTRSRAAAGLAGLAYGLSEAMLERQAHINFVHAFAWFPLMVLAIDRLLDGASWRWTAIGALATACCFLSGHPQPILYAVSFCALYALVGAIVQRVPPRVYLKTAAMFGLGGMLMSIKAIPFVQAMQLITRQRVSFDQFVSHANTPSQMTNLLFPNIAHDGREASLYVGLTVLMLAALGVTRVRHNWRAAIWLAAAVIVGMVGTGAATPIAGFLYLLPIYGRSRVITRMMFIFAFAAAALAGMGFAAAERREISRRTLAATVAIMLLLGAAGAAWLATGPPGIEFEFGARRLRGLPLWNAGVWIQLGIGVLAAVLTFWIAAGRRFRLAAAALIALVGVDLLHGVSYSVTPTGLNVITVPPSDLRPSVHAQWMAGQLAPLHQRMLAVRGVTRDAIVPGAVARLWHIPIAGGYGPILLERLTALATSGTNGDVRPETLAFDDAAFDVLAVRYIVVREDDFLAPPTFERSGHTWNAPPLDMKVGRDDCGYRYPRAKSIHIGGDEAISGVEIVAHLRCSEDVPQGMEVGAIDLTGAGGSTVHHPLVAGVNIAERSLSDRRVLGRAKHEPPASRFDDPELAPDVYLVQSDLATPVRDATLTFHGAPTDGWLEVDRLTLRTADGRERPQSLAGLYLGDNRRWREVSRIRTSRHTDRDRDETSSDELEYTVYENLHALPRAWVAAEVIPLAERDAVVAMRTKQLTDGRTFDPSRMAVVDDDGGATGARFEPDPSAARVLQIDDGRIAVDVTTAAGGFLVLSESYFPGWRAHIGDDVIPVQRTDLLLQGLPVPPGHHTVVFQLESTSLVAGRTLSAIGLACAALLLVLPRRAS
jgi:hypothetical protein